MDWNTASLFFFSNHRNGLNLSKAIHAKHVLTGRVYVWHTVAEGYNESPNSAFCENN